MYLFLTGNIAVVLVTTFNRQRKVTELVTAKFCLLHLAIADLTVGLSCVSQNLVTLVLETYAIVAAISSRSLFT